MIPHNKQTAVPAVMLSMANVSQSSQTTTESIVSSTKSYCFYFQINLRFVQN